MTTSGKIEQPSLAAESTATQSNLSTRLLKSLVGIFDKSLIVALGLIIGAIIGIVVALSTGLIEFRC